MTPISLAYRTSSQTSTKAIGKEKMDPFPLNIVFRSTYHWRICHRNLISRARKILQLGVIWIAEMWHNGSWLIIVIWIGMIRWIGICVRVDKSVDNIYEINSDLFALEQRLVCRSWVNTWKYVAKGTFSMRIVYPLSHCHTSVWNCTTTKKKYLLISDTSNYRIILNLPVNTFTFLWKS